MACLMRFCGLALVMGLYVINANASALIAIDGKAHEVQMRLDNGYSVIVKIPVAGVASVEYQSPTDSNFPSLALPDDNTTSSQPITLSAEEGSYWLHSTGVMVKVTQQPFHLAFYDSKGVPRIEEEVGLFDYPSMRGFRFKLKDDEKLLGGGARVLGMDRRGHRLPLYNRAHYGYETHSEQMYFGLPAVISSRHYALVFDNTAKGWMDLGATEADILQFEAVAGRRAYIVVVGDSLQQTSQRLVQATGTQPLPPRWALGSFASRFGYHSEEETRAVVERYQQSKMPLDGVVLDLYWFGKDIKGHMGNLEWDRQAFPHAEKMVADFQQQHINTVVITEPFILSSSKQFSAAQASNALVKNLGGGTRTFDFYFGNTGLVDVFSEQGQNWFWQAYQRLLDQGIAGWWGDLGEPEVHPSDAIHEWAGRHVGADEIHNAYGHQWAKMVYERTLRARPQQRPFILMRAGFIGSQRYGMIPWTGDVSRTWGGLKPQVELGLQMGLFGLGYIHSDLGGFAGGETFDKELYLRWLQLGVFSPVFRPHGQEHIPSEPVFHAPEVQQAARSLLRMRYAMLPYNASLMIDNHITGSPFMRPLSYHFPELDTFDDARSYMWGDALLVSPVTAPGSKEWDVFLPLGDWYDFFTHQKYQGGTTHTISVADNQFPVFARAGAFVPMTKPAERTALTDWSKLTMRHWRPTPCADCPAQSYDYRYSEDDGQTPHSHLTYRRFHLDVKASHSYARSEITLTPTGRYQGMPTSRQLTWVIYGVDSRPVAASVDGVALEIEYEKEKSALTLKHVMSDSPSTLVIDWIPTV